MDAARRSLRAPTVMAEAKGSKASRGQANSCRPSEKCLAAFLAAAEPYVYMHCQYNGPDLMGVSAFPEMDYPLGDPDGPAVEVRSGVWRRRFGGDAHGAGGGKVTEVWWDNNAKDGNVTWGNAPPTPAPTPAPVMSCANAGNSTRRRSTVMSNTTFGEDDVAHAHDVETAAACCALCAETDGCVEWAWHGADANKACHAHGPNSVQHPQAGTVAGVMLS